MLRVLGVQAQGPQRTKYSLDLHEGDRTVEWFTNSPW